MIYCRECGNEMDDNRRFCCDCAAPLDRVIGGDNKIRCTGEAHGLMGGQLSGAKNNNEYKEEESAKVEGFYGEPQTVKVGMPCEDSEPKNMVVIRSRRALRGKSAVVTTGGFVGIFMLMLIPLVNLAALITWALGGCKKVVKQNFARAALLVALIALVLAGVNYIYGDLIVSAISKFLQDFEAGLAFSGVFGFFDKIRASFGRFK